MKKTGGKPVKGGFELEVADFGPIVEATVDLRPLTVFVGPSNTGKSYLAILIYALHRFFGGRGRPRGLLPILSFPIFDDRRIQEKPRELFDILAENMQKFSNGSRTEAESRIVLPSPLTDEVRSGLEVNGNALGREIGRCFGIDDGAALIRRGRRSRARVILRRRSSDESARLEHTLTLMARESEFKSIIPQEMTIQIDATNIDRIHDYLPPIDRERNEFESRAFVRHLVNLLGDLIRPHVAGPAYLPAYYLPADRTGVMHAHSVVVSALIRSAPMAGLRPATHTPVLSGVLADFLEQLIEIDRPVFRRRRGKHDLGAGIEERILGGIVKIERSAAIDYPRFTYRPDGWNDGLPLMHASSMVSELAPVVLYLRHLIRPGNILIIEEPESHLHPAMQVEFTRQLAALVQGGVRVIVTTHSEWLLEELANIVRRSELPAAQRSKKNGNPIALGSDQVGAWLFEPKKRPQGSVVKEIRLDDDSGLYPSGFDEVAAALHNDWAEITSHVEDDA